MTIRMMNQASLTIRSSSIDSGNRLRAHAANFWREFMYWWTARFPAVVLFTRPFFLFFANRCSRVLRDGPTANARRWLGTEASDAEVETLRRAIVRNAYTSIYELGRAVRATASELESWVEHIDGKQRYLATRRSGRGAILVTAHLGPFEVGITALADREKRIHVIYRKDERASFDRLRSKLRARLGVTEHPIDQGWSIWPRLRDALLSDEVVLIQGDRVMPGQRGVPVPFHSGHMLMPPGPVKLAMAAGSPIIPIFSIRTRVGRCQVVIEEPIEITSGSGRVTGDHPAMRAMAQAIERQVSRYPEQWAVFERAWCEDRRAQ